MADFVTLLHGNLGQILVKVRRSVQDDFFNENANENPDDVK